MPFIRNILYREYLLAVLSVLSPNWTKIVKRIQVSSKPGNNSNLKEIKGKDMHWQIRPIYPFCQPIDLLEYFGKELKPQQIVFYFDAHKTQNGNGIFLYVIERNTALRRRLLKSNMLSYNGPEIKLLDLHSDAKLFKVGFQLSQSIFIEHEGNIGCVNYPIENYENYRECDEDFMSHQINNLYGITPFWAAEDLSDVTLNKFDKFISLQIKMKYFRSVKVDNMTMISYMDGTQTSSCKEPCLNTYVCN